MERILLVDDEPGVRSTVQRLLERRGYRVDTAKDGAEALEGIADDPPHLVLLDVQMPRMDGMKFMRALRALAPDLPVVFVTGVDDEDNMRKAHDLGAVDYIVKPFDFEKLLSTVESVLAATKG